MQESLRQIDISQSETQGLSPAQAGQIEKRESCPMHHSTQWGAARSWKPGARVEEVPALFSAQNTLNERARANPQEVPGRNFISWILHGKKPTELADQAESMSACCLRSLAIVSDVRAHDVECDDRISGFELRIEESIKAPKGAFFLSIATPGGTLVLEEAFDAIRKRGREECGIHRSTSSIDRATVLRAERSTLVYTSVESRFTCPKTSPIVLIELPADSMRVASV
jgi:hypothetical protein